MIVLTVRLLFFVAICGVATSIKIHTARRKSPEIGIIETEETEVPTLVIDTDITQNLDKREIVVSLGNLSGAKNSTRRASEPKNKKPEMLKASTTASVSDRKYVSGSHNSKPHKKERKKSLRKHLLDTLFSGVDPFDYMEEREWLDDDFPFTNLSPAIVNLILRIQQSLQNKQVELYLELGTMFGGSLEVAHRADPNMTLLAIDTFLGEVNMWMWEDKERRPGHLKEFDFLDLYGGQPRIYERFLYNVKKQGFHNKVVPFRTTSIVGMKVLQRLYNEGYLKQKPEVIYLDAAHEEVETLLEIQEAWCLLPENGILYGDDWKWESVKSDVLKFSRKLKKSDEAVSLANKIHSPGGDVDIEVFDRRIVVIDDQTWILVKLSSDKACVKAFK